MHQILSWPHLHAFLLLCRIRLLVTHSHPTNIQHPYWPYTFTQQTSNTLVHPSNVNFQQTYFTPSVKRFTILRTRKFILNSRLFQFIIYTASFPHLRHLSPRLCNFRYWTSVQRLQLLTSTATALYIVIASSLPYIIASNVHRISTLIQPVHPKLHWPVHLYSIPQTNSTNSICSVLTW